MCYLVIRCTQTKIAYSFDVIPIYPLNSIIKGCYCLKRLTCTICLSCNRSKIYLSKFGWEGNFLFQTNIVCLLQVISKFLYAKVSLGS